MCGLFWKFYPREMHFKCKSQKQTNWLRIDCKVTTWQTLVKPFPGISLSITLHNSIRWWDFVTISILPQGNWGWESLRIWRSGGGVGGERSRIWPNMDSRAWILIFLSYYLSPHPSPPTTTPWYMASDDHFPFFWNAFFWSLIFLRLEGCRPLV